MGACGWALAIVGTVIVLVVLYSVFEKTIAEIFGKVVLVGWFLVIGAICLVVAFLVGGLLAFVADLLLTIDELDSVYVFGSVTWEQLVWKLPFVLPFLFIVGVVVTLVISFRGGGGSGERWEMGSERAEEELHRTVQSIDEKVEKLSSGKKK